jgi:Na+-transporting NADH:ubiquinone oxidoreductase subunit C
MSNDSTSKTLIVATLLCVVCSVVVSWSAVSLKPLQTKNKELDIKKNLLVTAGLVKDGASEKEIVEAFKNVETKIVDLATGDYTDDVDAKTFDSKKASKDPKQNYKIPADKDLARIRLRAKYEKVYLIKENGVVVKVVLPINGKGLWSTLYGFLVLAPDMNTVKGLGFYEHGETPGLGGEVDNPRWKQLWVGKKVFDDMMRPAIQVIKGIATPGSLYDIDGLSGATLTANGVTGLVRYWVSKDAFGPFMNKFKAGGM